MEECDSEKCSAEDDEFWPVFKIMWKLLWVTLWRGEQVALLPLIHTHTHTHAHMCAHTNSLLGLHEHCPLTLTPLRISIAVHLPLDRAVFLLGMPLLSHIVCLPCCQELKQILPLSGSPPGLGLLCSSTLPLHLCFGSLCY